MDRNPAVALHSEARGAGPSLLFLHGFAGSARNFRPQIRALEGRARCIAYDARGHARSAAPEEPSAYSPESFCSDAWRVLDEHGAGPAILCGLSMGASIALEMACRHPQRVRALVLASIPAGTDDEGGISQRALEFSDAILRDGISAAGERFVWGEASGLDPKARSFVRQGFMEHQQQGLALTLRGVLARLPTWARETERLAGLEIPTLVVAGGADRPSVRAGEQVARALPSAQFVCIEGAGHVVNLANPRAFNQALISFLDGLDSTLEPAPGDRKTLSDSR